MFNNENTIKATNISTFASEAMVHQIFEYIGKIKSLKLYPNPGLEGGKECLVEYEDSEAAGLALHLSGTKLYDRVFEVKIRTLEEIEQQKKILEISSMFNTPPALNPILQPNITLEKANKIARTVYVGNLNTTITEKELMDFFSVCGPISYAKMAGDVTHPSRFAFLEFATIEAARKAMSMSGSFFRDKIIKVNHSNNVINKGIKKNDQEMQEAMKGLKEAEMLINRKYSEIPVEPSDQLKIVGSSINPENKPETKLIPEMPKELDKPRRSRSRSRSRSRDRERSRRMRSRSRSRSRDYYRYMHRRDRDRERDRERDRDRERERRHKERYERELEHELMRERERERRRRDSRSRSSSRRKRYSDRERDHYRR